MIKILESKKIETKSEKSNYFGGIEITNRIANMSHRKASRIVGFGLLPMFFLSIIAVLFILQNLLVPGDTTTTVNNIKANQLQFYTGIVIYFIILTLDVIIAVALLVILKPVNKNLALLVTLLRLSYTAIMVISIFSLGLLYIDAYSNGVLIAYMFFIPHIFVLGYAVFKSGYIPKSLGGFLLIASFCYIILNFGQFFIPNELHDLLYMIAMVPATFAEISLGVWLLLRANLVEERITKMTTFQE
ncbi:MAG: DUF4386 domain-containing protein [Candidatus Hodarchaeota archaeon]